MNGRSLSGLMASCGLLLGTASPSLAEDEIAGKDWSFAITPYVWGAGLKGTAGAFPNGPPLAVDVSFGDVLKNLDIAVMTDLEVRYRRWGFFSDIVYTKIGAESDTPFGAGASSAISSIQRSAPSQTRPSAFSSTASRPRTKSSPALSRVPTACCRASAVFST